MAGTGTGTPVTAGGTTFTYDLSSSDATILARSKVRLLIPDTDSTTYWLKDAELDYFMAQVGNNVTAAAVKACRWLARKFAQKVGFTADGLSIQHSQRAEAFAKRADELEAEIWGSISTTDIVREDGYSEAATDTDYERRTVYIEVG